LVENLDLNHHHLGAMLMSKKITASNVKLKRAYERPAAGDGTRILIDRLWPRGVKKVNAAIDQWAKDIAPSTALRKWFDHDPARWQEFRSRYAAEVYEHPEQLKRLRALARQGPITLVFSAHDEVHNDAVALRDFLLGRQKTKRKPSATMERHASSPMAGMCSGAQACLERIVRLWSVAPSYEALSSRA
jgi:uncharacterized protein YeaO (DUF488 family)